MCDFVCGCGCVFGWLFVCVCVCVGGGVDAVSFEVPMCSPICFAECLCMCMCVRVVTLIESEMKHLSPTTIAMEIMDFCVLTQMNFAFKNFILKLCLLFFGILLFYVLVLPQFLSKDIFLSEILEHFHVGMLTP